VVREGLSKDLKDKKRREMDQEEVTKRTKLGLSERDIQILSGLEKWGVLGVGQINGLVLKTEGGEEEKGRLFFNETERKDYWTRAYKRIEQLRQAGYLKAEHEPKVYLLTGKGHEALKERGRARATNFRTGISPHLVGHEVAVAAVGLTIEKAFGHEARPVRERVAVTRGGWKPGARRGIPDLWMSGPVAKAIEVEMHAKGQLEYREIWDAYRLRLRGKGVVLYLTAMPEGERTITKWAAKFGADFVYACDLGRFKDAFGRAVFVGCRPGLVLALEPRPAAPSFESVPLPRPPAAAPAAWPAAGGVA